MAGNISETVSNDYQYTPLSGPRQIRVLRLKPSKSQQSPLEGELFEVTVDKSWPTYEAVSYTWGGQQPDHPILIDGKRLNITKNCADLLYNFRNPRMRDASKNRRLWVDSICINQADNEEKASQVPMMAAIYRRSSQVLIWLGEATVESDACFQTIRKTVPGWWNPFRSRKKFDARTDSIIDEFRARPKMLLDVVSRPWFSRMWTIQVTEAAASNFAVLFCGKEKLLIGTFFTMYPLALTARGSFPRNPAILSEQLRRAPLHHRIRLALSPSMFPEAGVGLGKTLDLAELMRDVRMCGAFLPKDKIFALHAVLLRQGIELPTPEYNDSVSAGEIYHATTLTMLKHFAPSPSLKLLQLVTGYHKELIGSTPSWVPDYSDTLPPWPVFDDSDTATGNTKPVYSFSPDGYCLSTFGIVVDQIDMVSNQTTWYPERSLFVGDDMTWETLKNDPVKTIRALQDWIKIATTLGSYLPTGETIQEAFFATIGAKRGRLDVHTVETLNRYLRDTEETGTESVSDFHPYMENHTFAADAQMWWSILLANDPRLGDSMQSLAGICARTPKISLIRERFGATFDVLRANESNEWKILTALSTMTGICETILTVCRKNTFFTTTGGYIGAGSHSIRRGDRVVLIPGLNSPMAIRPTGQKHHLVAPLYVHGMMKGEVWNKKIDVMSNATVGSIDLRDLHSTVSQLAHLNII